MPYGWTMDRIFTPPELGVILDKVNKRTAMLGWLGNWDYSRDVPTSWGKGFESVPREITLLKQSYGNRLVQRPIPEMQKLRKNMYQFKNRLVSGTSEIKEFKPAQNTYELEVTFDTNTSSSFGLNLLVGEGRKLVVEYDPLTSNLSVDRTQCTDFTSNQEFNRKFQTKINATVRPDKGKLRLHILVDQASVEIFTNQGEIVLSALTFPAESQTGVEVFTTHANVRIVDFKAWELSSIWEGTQKN